MAQLSITIYVSTNYSNILYSISNAFLNPV
jgi:hypothetical protein